MFAAPLLLTALALAAGDPAATPPSEPGPPPAESPAQSPPVAPAAEPVAVTFGAPAPMTRREEVLAKDVADLATMIAGRWDTDGQVFFEPELGIPRENRRARVHARVRPLPDTVFGKPAFFVEHRSGSETGTVLRQRVWTLSVDAQRDGVRMDVLAPTPGTSLAEIWSSPDRFASLQAGQFTEVAGCDLLWRRRGGGFTGETRAGACRITSTAGTGSVTLTEQHDLTAAIWDVRDLGVDEQGTRVFGAEDGRPTRFDRAVSYLCWAGRIETPDAVATGLVTHDRGGELRIGDPARGGYRVRLRTVEWPFGNNRPSLTLYLFTRPGEEAEAYAWADPGAERIAISLRGLQASCTRAADTLWD